MNPKRNLGLLETLGLSLSIIAPTMGISIAIILAVQVAGTAAPLTFVFGAAAMVVLGFSFVAFEKRVSTPGSVYAYISHTFGAHAGFLAGWTLLLTYIGFMAGADALAGSFLALFCQALGFETAHLWILLSLGTLLLSAGLAWRDARIAARVMLALEGVSILAILVLCCQILAKTHLSMAPLQVDPRHGWSGLGYGMAFAILAFGGFEGAATLKEEARDPQRTVPIAILGTAILSGILFTLFSYAAVTGYGMDHIQLLSQADAPFSALSEKFISHRFAIFLELATAISAFACTLGSLTAAARMAYTLGRSGTASTLAVLDRKHNTPARAIFILTIAAVLSLLLLGARMGVNSYSGAGATIAVLALILVYIGVAVAEVVEAIRVRQFLWILLGSITASVLLWPLWNSLYPAPPWPGNLFPYVVLIWSLLGVLLCKRSVRAG